MSSKVTDVSYLKLSELTYKTKLKSRVTILHNDVKENWDVLTRKSIKGTGFDATVYKNGNNVVIAYRGTEGNEPLGRGYKDIVADARYVVFKQKTRIEKFPNQFNDSVKFTKEIKNKYPNATVTLTGHSLGGALAAYAGAIENIEAVTYSSPSVIDILPEDVKRKADRGEFDSRIINYVHPQDSVGAGYIREYRKHIGSTYYIGSRFEIENVHNIDNPLSRMLDSVSKYHGLDVYKFDQYGNLKNSIITNAKTDKELIRSPRYQSYYSVSTNSSHIDINPRELMEYATILERRITSFQIRHKDLMVKLLQYNHIKEARGIENVVSSSVSKFFNWYEDEILRMSRFIGETAHSYEEVEIRVSKEASKFK